MWPKGGFGARLLMELVLLLAVGDFGRHETRLYEVQIKSTYLSVVFFKREPRTIATQKFKAKNQFKPGAFVIKLLH